MELKVYSMYDKKTMVYGKPFYAHNDGHAVRLVQNEVDNADSQLAKYPSDFQLCCIGCFCDDTGTIQAQDMQVVIEVNQLVKKGE